MFNGFFSKKKQTYKQENAQQSKQLNRLKTESKLDSEQSLGESDTLPNYNPRLIAKLKRQHRELERLFSEMTSFAQSGDIKSLHNSKREFNATLLGHLGIENSVLYRHIQYHYKDDPDVISLMMQFKTEMRDIQKTLTSFFVAWPDIATLENDLETFIAGLSVIGDALNLRIGSEEETLYEIYENIAFIFEPA